jgi:hypothetical protein
MKTNDERIEEVTKWADRVSEKADYPVKNAKGLLDAIGDDDTEVEYAGRKMKLGEIKKALPKEFFPVESREDLIAKIGYLETRGEREQKPNEGEKRSKAPDDAGDPPPIGDSDKKGRPGGMPGVRGHGKASGKGGGANVGPRA